MTTPSVETAMLRILPTAASVLVMSACQPSLPFTSPAGSVATAVFDPLTAKIPLPNDLALPPFNSVNTVCPPPGNTAMGAPACAQAELLASFNGYFPGDQEVAITIDFTQANIDASGKVTQVAPDLDLASFTPKTFFVFNDSPPYQGEVPIDAPKAGDYVKNGDHGTLTLHHQGHAPWTEGSYSVLVRGGANGIKTTGGAPVYASQVFELVAQGLDMTDPKNLGLLKAQTGSTAAAIEQGRQLNVLIALYQNAAYPVADTRFPHQELAIVTTFKIAPPVTNVSIDPARGLVPLPFDLLRDPVGGKLTPLAACTLAGSSLNDIGICGSAAAAGFAALDGFSTTGAILAPTSELIQAATVTPASLLLYDLTDPAHPAQVNPATLILEPCELTSGCGSPTALSPVIAIQPAGATAGDPTSVFRTRPLKDSTDYAVVITTAIHDKAGRSVGPGTVANVLRFTNPVVVGGHSALLGIDDATAAGLEKMRLQLVPVFATLAAAGTDRSKVAIAYTFRTQTILSQAVQLAALPYSKAAATALPVSVTALTPSEAFKKYGVVPRATPADTTPGAVPLDHIDEILEADIVTFDALDPATGAFLVNPAAAAPVQIHVLIATPRTDNTNLGDCGGTPCAPMMVFRHGFRGGRADMLTVADVNAEAGMVTVAIDAAKHGDRAFCTTGPASATSGCINGGACSSALPPSVPPGAQGDVNPPGTCGSDDKFVKRPVSASCTGTCASSATDGIPLVSGNFLISANLFRTRDSMRQDLIDQSQLVRALAFVPPEPAGVHHVVFEHMAQRGVIINPSKIFFSGQSLGALQGTMDVATNPRISKAVFNVGGGSIVDIFTNSPAFAAAADKLLAELGIEHGSAEFLQFLVVAKTVLDPADPVNFAGHLTASTLPNLLANPDGSVPQAAKKILTQVANCDAVVPNPFSFVYASNVATSPLPTGAAFFAPGATGTFQLFVTTPFNPATFGSCAASTVEHGFLTDWVTPSLTANAQSDLASFVMLNTSPLSVQHQ
jgi:hypothetical protein